MYLLGRWDQAVALQPRAAVGRLGARTADLEYRRRPSLAGCRTAVELYIKTGIVLLGAGLPVTLLVWAGPVAMVQAGIVSLVTFGVIYACATRLGLDRRLAATLGTGGAVCGVSGAIAVGGAVGAKKEQDISVAISLVVAWAIVMIFAASRVARTRLADRGRAAHGSAHRSLRTPRDLRPRKPTAVTPGASRIAGHADAGGHRVHSHEGHRPRRMDRRMGLRARVFRRDALGAHGRRESRERRRDLAQVPEVRSGFLAASILVTAFASGYDYAAYKKDVIPGLVAPLQALRTWAFTFAFLSIGLTTTIARIRRRRRAPVHRLHARRVRQCPAGIFPVDSGFWRLLEEPLVNESGTMSPARIACAACCHFSNDPAALESELPALRTLSSAYAAVRSNDGLCAVHRRYVSASSACASYAASTSTRQS